MTSPEPHEARLSLATDQEWLDGHAALTDLLEGSDFPMEELTFIWDPALSPSSLIEPDEVDHAPSYSEDTDGSS